MCQAALLEHIEIADQERDTMASLVQSAEDSAVRARAEGSQVTHTHTHTHTNTHTHTHTHNYIHVMCIFCIYTYVIFIEDSALRATTKASQVMHVNVHKCIHVMCMYTCQYIHVSPLPPPAPPAVRARAEASEAGFICI